jgi:hypothetical protein
MMIRLTGFNLYLLAALMLAAVWGCSTPESQRKKQVATLRLYEEVARTPMSQTQEVLVFTNPPIKMTISPQPFVSEKNVAEAKVIDVVGGYAISIQFDHEGTLLLEQFTSTLHGHHIAVFSQFNHPPEDKKLNQGRWLAAPQISTHIADGHLSFMPNATRDEAERIARGLNNIAAKSSPTTKW